MDINLLGFAVMNHYEKKPWQLKFKVVINSEESQEYEVDLSTDMVEEDGLLYIDFQKMNIAPMRISADTSFHLCAKSKCADNNRFTYGYDGSNYKQIED